MPTSTSTSTSTSALSPLHSTRARSTDTLPRASVPASPAHVTATRWWSGSDRAAMASVSASRKRLSHSHSQSHSHSLYDGCDAKYNKKPCDFFKHVCLCVWVCVRVRVRVRVRV